MNVFFDGFNIFKMLLCWAISILIALLWRRKSIGTVEMFYSLNNKNCVNKIVIILHMLDLKVNVELNDKAY